ncbi:MAG: hypothetical protein IPN95_14315 [Bacteroidetes bacterium]|nr:hypothetical protein [Bacteroidota bacterium]
MQDLWCFCRKKYFLPSKYPSRRRNAGSLQKRQEKYLEKATLEKVQTLKLNMDSYAAYSQTQINPSTDVDCVLDHRNLWYLAQIINAMAAFLRKISKGMKDH